MTLASFIANLTRKALSFMGRTKSTTKTCPDGSVVRFNQKCPITSGTAGQTSGGTVTPSALGGTFTLAENAAANAVAGALTGVTIGSTLSLVNSAGSRIALSGSNVVRGAVALDYETAQSHSFTVRESNATFISPGYHDSVLTLAVTNVNDTNPNAFSLTDVVNASTSTVYTSNAIAISGLSSYDTASASIAGDASSQMQKSNGSWGTSPVTVANGDTLVVRHTSSASAGTVVTTTLTVGNKSDTFTSATAGAIAYDTSFGTSTDSSGVATFGLHSGSRQVFCNTNGGFSDANNGLTPATAKASVAGAISVFFGAGFSAADQLMLAEGGIYAELTGNSNLSGKGGVSKTYPTAILSYDPADPTNVAKYGRATGAAMPVITFPSLSTGAGQCLFSVAGDDGTTNYIAVQGVELKYAGNDGNACSAIYVGRHDGICYQNFRLNGINLVFPNNASGFGFSQGIHVSKGSAWGQWTADGNTEALYFEGINGLYFEDCTGVHCAWKLGASRDDATSAGGTSALGHFYYYHANCTNGHINRIVTVDSATDGHNIRGSATATYLVSLDNPIAANLTGISAVYSEAPSGSVDAVTDCLFMGGADINTANARGYGIKWSNAATAGCILDNALMIDNPTYGGVNNRTMLADASNSGVTSAAITLNRVTTWNYSPQLQFISGTETVTLNWTNSITDTLAPGGTGNSVWGPTTFPNAKTRDQVITALLTAAAVTPGASYTARKAQLVNLMLYRPDLDWARYLVSIAYPAFNKTQSLSALSPPDLSAVTPAAIY